MVFLINHSYENSKLFKEFIYGSKMRSTFIIESENQKRKALSHQLNKEGHEIHEIESASEAFRIIKSKEHCFPCVVISAFILKDLSGVELCRRLRREHGFSQIGIIIISEAEDETCKVLSFEAGADDFVNYSLSIRELSLRISALTKRLGKKKILEINSDFIKIDPEKYKAWLQDNEIILTKIEFQILKLLLENQNKVISRETLLEKVWEENHEVNIRTVDAHIKRLRKKLGKSSSIIETIRGIGYRYQIFQNKV